MDEERVPIYQGFLDGNVAETRTLLLTLGTVLQRFLSVRRLPLVADFGLLSLDNLESLREIRSADSHPPEFIVVMLGRLLQRVPKGAQAFHKAYRQDAQAEVISEQSWHDLRLVVAHDPVAAAEPTSRRNGRIAVLTDQANAWT